MTSDANQSQNGEFPDDTPAELSACLAVAYENHAFHRLHRTCSGEPLGGAEWRSESELVRVMGYQDQWAVEASPIERRPAERSGESETDEEIHIIEYEMDAEYGLKQTEAYRLADAYMRGDEDLSEDAWWMQDGGGETEGQQTLDDIAAQ